MFCIMNIQKRKKNDIGGICAEANRNEDDKPVYDDDGNRISGKEFRNSKIDWERTRDNLFLRKSKNLQADVQNEIEQFAPDALVRKDSVMMCDVIFSASPEFFDACYCDGVNLFFEKADDYFNDCMKFAEREFGHVVNAVVHYDETTPHMHLQFVPITKDGRLSAKEVLGNRKQYSERQDRFFENVGKKWGLDRGIRKSTESTRQHLTVAEYKAQTLENAVSMLKQNRILPKRHQLITLGILLNMTEQDLNHMLNLANMLPLYPRDQIDALMIYLLTSAVRENPELESSNAMAYVEYGTNLALRKRYREYLDQYFQLELAEFDSDLDDVAQYISEQIKDIDPDVLDYLKVFA